MAIVCVVGAWHQASVVGPCLAELGHDVRGTALEAEPITRLAAGEPPVAEPGLPELLARQLAAGRLRYTPSFELALDGADVVLIALDTPVGGDDRPQLEPVFDAVRAVARAAATGLPLVVSAQVPVGTCDAIRDELARVRPELAWRVAYVPEFLRLGTAVDLFLRPDRIVIGADDDTLADRVAELYAAIDAPKLRLSVRSAEMAKHASNAFLAASISFVNELAGLCEETGCDALGVAQAMKLDARIGPRAFLSPGLGFAGGTLGRDVRSLQAIGATVRRPTRLLDAVMDVNEAQTRLVVDRLLASLSPIQGKDVAVLGLTYKPGTSALRRSVALETAEALLAHGARVRAHDPLVPTARQNELPTGIQIADDPIAAARGANATVLMTEWPIYQQLDWSRVAEAMTGDLVIDARNALEPAAIRAAGLRYWGIGRADDPRSHSS